MDEEKKEKPTGLIILDLIFSTVLIVLSCYLAFRIQWTEMYIGIPILVAAAVAFFLGYFRLIAYIPQDAPKAETRLFLGCIVAIAAVIQLIGFVNLYYNTGNQGTAICFLTLVESFSIIITYPQWEKIASSNGAIHFSRISILVLILIGVYINVIKKYTIGSIFVSAYMLVDCIALSTMAFHRTKKN